MITGHINDLIKYTDKTSYDLICSFIERVKTSEVPSGEWIFLNEDIKVLVLKKSGYNEGVFESHKVYKDVHIVVEGKDKIFAGDSTLAEIKSDYDPKGDYTLFNSKAIYNVMLKKDSFAILDKEEIHSNEITDEHTVKIVVKLKN